MPTTGALRCGRAVPDVFSPIVEGGYPDILPSPDGRIEVHADMKRQEE